MPCYVPGYIIVAVEDAEIPWRNLDRIISKGKTMMNNQLWDFAMPFLGYFGITAFFRVMIKTWILHNTTFASLCRIIQLSHWLL